MQISAGSTIQSGGQAQRILAALLNQGAEATGQGSPGSSKAPGGPPPGAPPGPPPGGCGKQFATNTLGSLLAVQETPPESGDLASRLIDQADGDGDGALSLAEIQTALGSTSSDATASAVESLDTDGDGKLGAEELSAALEARRPAGPPPPSSDDMASRLIGEVDSDADGLLSLEEIEAELGVGETSPDSLASAYSGLDTNGDGKLSAAELSAALGAFRSAGGHAVGREAQASA